MLYVKPALSTRRMMVEALAAQVAQCMGLPCPSPFLVTVRPQHVGRPAGSARIIAFGSEAVGPQALARSVMNVNILMELLQQLKLTETACVFDEWIANSVRSPRDVLFDPGSGAAIIDHEGAMERDTRPDEAITNWLAARLLERTPDKDRPALLRALQARTAAAHRARLSEVPAQAMFVQDGQDIYLELLQFLEARLHHLNTLISKRVLPEQGTLAL